MTNTPKQPHGSTSRQVHYQYTALCHLMTIFGHDDYQQQGNFKTVISYSITCISSNLTEKCTSISGAATQHVN